jgi:hypothetical protein
VVPVLGGPGLRTLYCGTAVTTMEEHSVDESMGAVESIEVDVAGV